MKKYIALALAALLFAACANQEEQLRLRATELCPYIPDHELKAGSERFLTPDFYAALDTMFNHLPAEEAMEHEWLYYFVTSNGGTVPVYEVAGVQLTDDSHAVATVLVTQQWEDGSPVPDTEGAEHRLYMQLVDGQWLMSDFDEHKQDCLDAIAESRKE